MAVEPVELTVKVGVPVIVQVAGEDQTVPVPARVLVTVVVTWVPVKPVLLMLKTVPLAPEDHVTVTVPDRAVKNTVSAAPGTVAPGAPPSVVDQLLVALFQLLVPPTQYLAAMCAPYACVVTATTSQRRFVLL